MTEQERYEAIAAQITQLLDNAANDHDSNGMIGLGSVWLAAEMYTLNEKAHEQASNQERKPDG